MGEVSIFMANHLIPGVVGMKGIGVVPRVVHYFSAAVVVGTHHKGDFSGKVHEPLGFGLVFITIGVRTSMWVGIVAVHVYAVGILSSGTIDCVIAAMVGAVGVGIRADVKVDVVHHVLHLGLIWILKQIVDKAEHQNPSRGLVAVDGRSVEELGFAFSCAVVEVRNHDFAATGQRAEGDDFAFVGMVGLEFKHHVFVCLIGRVAVPIVFGAVAAVPHSDFLQHGRRSLKRNFVSEFHKTGKILVVGVSGHHIAVNAVDGNGLGNGFQVVVAVQTKSKIVLVAFLHELV